MYTPAKRRKRANSHETQSNKRAKRPSQAPPTQAGNSHNEGVTPDLIKSIVTSIIPAVTQGVVTSLKELGVISNAVTQADPLPEPVPAPQSVELPETVSLVADTAVTSQSAVTVTPPVVAGPSSSGFTTNNSAYDQCPPISGKAVSISRPLSLGIDEKIKGKIWSNQFIEFSSLFQNHDSDKLELVNDGNGVLTCKKAKSGSIKTVDKWFEAFHIFTSIYTSKSPMEAPSLMKYADTVQKLGKQAGDAAALYYDKQFRLWRQDTPELLPWDQLNNELFTQALAMGLTSKGKGNFPSQKKQKPSSKKQYCFQFNNNNGQCHRAECPFLHQCQKCDGSHSRKQCTSKQPNNTGKDHHANDKRATPKSKQ